MVQIRIILIMMAGMLCQTPSSPGSYCLSATRCQTWDGSAWTTASNTCLTECSAYSPSSQITCILSSCYPCFSYASSAITEGASPQNPQYLDVNTASGFVLPSYSQSGTSACSITSQLTSSSSSSIAQPSGLPASAVLDGSDYLVKPTDVSVHQSYSFYLWSRDSTA